MLKELRWRLRRFIVGGDVDMAVDRMEKVGSELTAAMQNLYSYQDFLKLREEQNRLTGWVRDNHPELLTGTRTPVEIVEGLLKINVYSIASAEAARVSKGEGDK